MDSRYRKRTYSSNPTCSILLLLTCSITSNHQAISFLICNFYYDGVKENQITKRRGSATSSSLSRLLLLCCLIQLQSNVECPQISLVLLREVHHQMFSSIALH